MNHFTKLKKVTFKHRLVSAVLAATMVLVPSMQIVSAATTQQLQDQINQLNAANSDSQSTVSGLQSQAANYQDAINKLQEQINSIRGAIAANQAKQADLQQQIIANQALIVQKKATLGEDIKAMYVDGTPSTIELLATSNNLSDYFDKQEYRTKVQSKLQDTLKQIAALQQQLQAQKVEVEQLLATQQQQQAQLDASQAEQGRLLSLNQQQQDAYNAQIQANKGQIAELQRQQAEINRRNSLAANVQASGGNGGACDNGSGNGGYPMVWCDAYQDTLPTIDYSSDPINRECTSFAYWYFTSQEGNSLHVTGNAKDWVYTANRPVDNTPEVGSIGISTAGYYGHVMIILALSGQTYHGFTVAPGYVLTMSMNYDYAGHFHVDQRAASSLYYIH
ncbi:MAG: CHAP domain-containing protein [Patescibacteria group bacterium]|nr:CHAP domain-containing protein [Patescibacteria group bacterium]